MKKRLKSFWSFESTGGSNRTDDVQSVSTVFLVSILFTPSTTRNYDHICAGRHADSEYRWHKVDLVILSQMHLYGFSCCRRFLELNGNRIELKTCKKKMSKKTILRALTRIYKEELHDSACGDGNGDMSKRADGRADGRVYFFPLRCIGATIDLYVNQEGW